MRLARHGEPDRCTTSAAGADRNLVFDRSIASLDRIDLDTGNHRQFRIDRRKSRKGHDRRLWS